MRLLVVTSAPVLFENGGYAAYSPLVYEIDLWFKSGSIKGILAPGNYPKSVFVKQFANQQIRFYKLPFFKLSNVLEIFRFFLISPILFIQFFRSFLWADHIHLRCPGNVGLMGCVLQIFFPQKSKTAKYAGNWDPDAIQPWSYRLQKWILRNSFLTRNMQVLVYGEWPSQSENVVPFFTASYSEQEREIISKEIKVPYKLLFVGNLVPGKQPEVALQIVEELNKRNIPAELHVYGDGELMEDIENQTVNKPYIHLHGNQPREVLKQAYKESHFLILASQSEGWPKVVAEAMWFACIPVTTGVSCVPWMLKAPPSPKGGVSTVMITERGILIPAFEGKDKTGEWIKETCNAIQKLLMNPEELRRMSKEAQEWSQQYTLERFETEIKKLLVPKDARP